MERGQKVKIKDTELDGFISDVRKKITNRVGFVVGFVESGNTLIIEFPAIGRRKVFRGRFNKRYLDIVED